MVWATRLMCVQSQDSSSLNLSLQIACQYTRSETMPDKPKPYLIAALLSEKILKEENGTLSVIRIADKIEWETAGMPDGVKLSVPIEGLISVKSGPCIGNFNLRLVIIRPSGKRKEVAKLPIELKGGDHGANYVLQLGILAEEEGLHWIEVFFEEEELTRIPIMLLRKQKSEEPTIHTSSSAEALSQDLRPADPTS